MSGRGATGDAGRPGSEWIEKFEQDLAADVRFERSILHRELWIIVAILVLVSIRQVLL